MNEQHILVFFFAFVAPVSFGESCGRSSVEHTHTHGVLCSAFIAVEKSLCTLTFRLNLSITVWHS